jgi:hypothetical protein
MSQLQMLSLPMKDVQIMKGHYFNLNHVKIYTYSSTARFQATAYSYL